MKSKAYLSIIIVASLLIGTVAYASSATVNGATDGGTSGTTNCIGVLYYYNLSTPGEDYVWAETSSVAAGSLYARARIYYTYTGGGSSYSQQTRSTSSTECPTSKAYADTDSQATSASGRFTYDSGAYGSWERSVSRSY